MAVISESADDRINNPAPVCEAVLSYTEGSETNPHVTMARENDQAYSEKTFMCFSDHAVGDVSARYTESACERLGTVRGPDRAVNGDLYAMSSVPTSERGNTCGDGIAPCGEPADPVAISTSTSNKTQRIPTEPYTAIGSDGFIARTHARTTYVETCTENLLDHCSFSSTISTILSPISGISQPISQPTIPTSPIELTTTVPFEAPGTGSRSSSITVSSNAPSPAVPSSLKIMIVGDSITHGHDGDYTWRYRLWQWFEDSTDIDVEFVGPYQGTQPAPEPAPPQPPRLPSDPDPPNGPFTSGRYAQDVPKEFDRHHFAVWGRQLAQAKSLIGEQVEEFQPDMLLVMLGFNDLGWYRGLEGKLDNVRTFIEEARTAKSSLAFAIANVPQRTHISGRDDLAPATTEYNAMLEDEIDNLTTQDSLVELVDIEDNYECQPDGCPAGYDGLHPNALGEFQIARAFSLTLCEEFNFGTGPLNVSTQIPRRPVPVPSNIKAEGAPTGVKATWDEVYGARGYDVRSRVKGHAEWGEARAATNRFDTTFTLEGVDWEYQIRTSGGDDFKGDWSQIFGATAQRDTAPGPRNIRIRSTSDSIDLSWDPPEGKWNIDRYEVFVWDQDTPGAMLNSRGVRGTSATIGSLLVGNRYAVAVATWTELGGGLARNANTVIVGAGTTAAPSNL